MADTHTGKYVDLWRWLKSRDGDTVRTTFAEIEDVLGFGLPPSSRNHLAHWYGYKGSAVARAIRDAGWKASHVNLTAQTVELTRLTGQGDRLDDLADHLHAREVEPPLADVVLRFAETHAVEICNPEANPLPVSAAHDAYAAAYVGRRDLSIALDTDDARRTHERLSLRLEVKDGPTSYVHVGPADLDRDDVSRAVPELLARAFERAFQGPRWDRGLPDRQLARGGICPTCFQEMPVVGSCPNCE